MKLPKQPKARPPAKKKRKPNTHRVQSCKGKVRYRDHGEAIAALRKVREDSARGTVPARTYECDRCGGWHLTSHERWDGR